MWLLNLLVGLFVSQSLIQSAQPFTLASGTAPSMLVLGDSTAVGVGASFPSESVAGRIATALHLKTVENYAVSGARITDIPQQIERAQADSYDFILVMVGANDIIRFVKAETAEQSLKDVLKILPQASTTILTTAGNMGAVALLPPFLKKKYTALTLEYHGFYKKLAENNGSIFVNMYEPIETDPFSLEPSVYLARDSFHPSSEGYRLWAERILNALSVKI
jgi:lysophospholipase L1-like esterase